MVRSGRVVLLWSNRVGSVSGSIDHPGVVGRGRVRLHGEKG